MSDLLESLILPNSSQESFHSLAESPSPSSPTDVSANHNSATPNSSSQSQPSAVEAAGLPIYLLVRAPNQKNAPTKQPKPEVDPGQPVLLGSQSAHHLTAFNLLCQQKGIVPDFQIEGDASNADFGGLLKIGDETIVDDERWHSKKEARQALAEKGLEAVKKMEAKKKEKGVPSEERNWIGTLLGRCPVSLTLEQF